MEQEHQEGATFASPCIYLMKPWACPQVVFLNTDEENKALEECWSASFQNDLIPLVCSYQQATLWCMQEGCIALSGSQSLMATHQWP